MKHFDHASLYPKQFPTFFNLFPLLQNIIILYWLHYPIFFSWWYRSLLFSIFGCIYFSDRRLWTALLRGRPFFQCNILLWQWIIGIWRALIIWYYCLLGTCLNFFGLIWVGKLLYLKTNSSKAWKSEIQPMRPSMSLE